MGYHCLPKSWTCIPKQSTQEQLNRLSLRSVVAPTIPVVAKSMTKIIDFVTRKQRRRERIVSISKRDYDIVCRRIRLGFERREERIKAMVKAMVKECFRACHPIP